MALILPFVSRATLELALARAETAEARADRIQAQYHSVVERMVEMKKEGFTTKPAPVEPLKPSESALAPEVEFAIEERASNDPGLRRYLNRYAQQQLALNKDPGAVATLIREGESED